MSSKLEDLLNKYQDGEIGICALDNEFHNMYSTPVDVPEPLDREKLASILFLAKRGDHAVIEIDKIQIMEESYREADCICHALKSTS